MDSLLPHHPPLAHPWSPLGSMPPLLEYRYLLLLPARCPLCGLGVIFPILFILDEEYLHMTKIIHLQQVSDHVIK